MCLDASFVLKRKNVLFSKETKPTLIFSIAWKHFRNSESACKRTIEYLFGVVGVNGVCWSKYEKNSVSLEAFVVFTWNIKKQLGVCFIIDIYKILLTF